MSLIEWERLQLEKFWGPGESGYQLVYFKLKFVRNHRGDTG